MSSLDLAATQRLSSTLVDEVERAVVGKRAAVTLVLTGLLADGHVLIDDNPGVAKTLLARSLAAVTSLGFRRIQFTPDLLPADITGSTLFDPRTHEPNFLPGPLFANLILADEVNRAPPKTQSALLEAMQERQVTVDGITRPARRAVPCHRHAEPDRVRGHLPVARSAARPLPAASHARLSRPPTTNGSWCTAASCAHRRSEPQPRHRRAHAHRDAARDRGRACVGGGRPLHRGAGRGHPAEPAARSGRGPRVARSP